ncbi:response regulator transcription factor [Actinomyces gerencseriae]|uniref:response regulator transcription factor n=1 Tax=Actinomyces gerencseriae TaxID=52769 RepID=UPI0036F1A7D6
MKTGRRCRFAGIIGAGREIAARLGLSERTIETYVRRLFAKLHVCSRSEVAARFVNHLSK